MLGGFPARSASTNTHAPGQMQLIYVQLPGPQVESYSESKAALPAQAQRINSLLASDKEFASCRVKSRGGYDVRRGGGRRGGRWSGGRV